MRSPSGDSITLTTGRYEAELVEVGAGLRALRRDGHDIVDGYGAGEMCSAGRGQLLIPWPNRVADGRYTYQGEHRQLALTEPSHHNAIHGLTRWLAWRPLRRDGSSASYGLRLHPQPGYPHSLELRVDYALADSGLAVQVQATHIGASPAPYGQGMHPYLTVGRRVDDCLLTLPADTYRTVDERGLPGDSTSVDGSDYDFRSARAIGDTSLDHPFGTLNRDSDANARATLTDPATDRSVSLWADSAYPWLQAFTGDTLGSQARTALAVEPMTC
ncbi:MAG: aldose 1-epimerase family protein, partial [Nocardioidaceae bacterium]